MTLRFALAMLSVLQLLAAPPKLFLDTTDIARVTAAAKSNSAAWQSLIAECEAYKDATVHTVPSNILGSIGNPVVPGSTGTDLTHYITADYQAEGFAEKTMNLATCYYVGGLIGYNSASLTKFGMRLTELAWAASRPAPIAKVPITYGSFTVTDGIGRISSPSLGSGNGAQLIKVEGTGNALLDGMRTITSYTATDIYIKVPGVTNGTYTPTLYFAAYVGTFGTPTRVNVVYGGNPTRLSLYSFNSDSGITWTTGDTLVLADFTGAWSVLNGSHTLTVSGADVTIPLDTTGLGNLSNITGTAWIPGKRVRIEHRVNSAVSSGATIQLFRAGTPVVMEGWEGCTDLNGSFVADDTGTAPNSVRFALKSSGGDPINYTNACTNYNYVRISNTGYSSRNFLPAISMVYSYAYDLLSTDLKTDLINCINGWHAELVRMRGTYNHFGENFSAGAFSGMSAADVVFSEDNPIHADTIAAWWNERWTETGGLKTYFNQWLPYGGHPQGHWSYGAYATRNLMWAVLAKLAVGVDLTASPNNFLWPAGMINYYYHFITPTLTELGGENWATHVGVTNAVESTRLPLFNVQLLTYWAWKTGSAEALRMQDFYNDTTAAVDAAVGAGVTPTSETSKLKPQLWQAFLFDTTGNAASDWTAGANLTGYGWEGSLAATRTDRTENSVYVTFESLHEIDAVDNGKTQYEAGAVTVRKGRKRLIVYPLSEYARAGTSAQWETMAADNRNYAMKIGNQWWAEQPGGANGAQNHLNKCNPIGQYGMVPAILNYRHVVPTRYPRIALKEDQSTYVYWYGSDLECAYGITSSIGGAANRHATWNRSVLFLRSLGVVVTYDRTAAVSATDDSYMMFSLPRTPVLSDPGSGMRRYTVTHPVVGYSGALTFVFPQNVTTTLRDYRSNGIVYQVDAYAPSGSSDNFRLLTVIDTADSAPQLQALVPIKGTNVEAVQIGSGSVVGFPITTTPTFPISYDVPNPGTFSHYVAGLAPSTTYKVNVVGQTVSIDTSGSGNDVVASSAGVLVFATTGSGLALEITTATLPDATEDAAYTQSILATGGTAPYTFSLASGTLCDGLNLSSGGVISGTPTTAGVCSFTVRVTDSAASYDDQSLSITVAAGPTPSYTVSVTAAQPASTSVVLTFRISGLVSNMGCTANVYDAGTEVLVGTATDTGGTASRQLAVTGLTASISYVARVTCGTEVSADSPFTTLSSSVETRSVSLSLKPPTSLGAGLLRVQYGPAFASSVTDDTADGSGRYSVTIPAQTVGSIVQYRWQWLTAADVAVTGVSKTRFAVVK